VSAQPDYDRHARLYDRLIGNRLYNRLVWGIDPARYAAFTAEAVVAGSGPMLDAGCGTAVFSAAAYRTASRPLTLVDQSAGMLARARERLAGTPAELVQADLFALPFAPGRFETVGCFAMLHVLDDPWAGLIALRPQLAPGGTLFVSMLVGDRGGLSRAYLGALRRRGEVGPPRSADELRAAAVPLFGEDLSVERVGAMAFLRARVAT
jgi:SAM-dependent methyltransferase